jgi:hypothetical protein
MPAFADWMTTAAGRFTKIPAAALDHRRFWDAMHAVTGSSWGDLRADRGAGRGIFRVDACGRVHQRARRPGPVIAARRRACGYRVRSGRIRWLVQDPRGRPGPGFMEMPGWPGWKAAGLAGDTAES